MGRESWERVRALSQQTRPSSESVPHDEAGDREAQHPSRSVGVTRGEGPRPVGQGAVSSSGPIAQGPCDSEPQSPQLEINGDDETHRARQEGG